MNPLGDPHAEPAPVIWRTILSAPFLLNFYKLWTKLDVTQLASIIAIASTLSSVTSSLRGLWRNIYWWFVKNFTSSISIASHDRLNAEILNWVGVHVLDKQDPRILTAQSKLVYGEWRYYQPERRSDRDTKSENKIPIRYLPSFGSTWFFHKGSLIIAKVINEYKSWDGTPDAYQHAPTGDEPLLVMCFGRSAKPIKLFFETCRIFAQQQTESCVNVVIARKDDKGWSRGIMKSIRPMHTVHFDETVKSDLIDDIKLYLHWETREFYRLRGIPYRRGYLLHGPPGTGKTSLCLALAGLFELDLYQLHLPSMNADSDLEYLFARLPRACIIILEDIDAVGMSRAIDNAEKTGIKKITTAGKKSAETTKARATSSTKKTEDDDSDDDADTKSKSKKSKCTLSGLLNVIDGLASQEGRILIMTSNVPGQLDAALIRPGRIDKMVYLGDISKESVKAMFLRMYLPNDQQELKECEKTTSKLLQILSAEFAEKIPQDTFTPAQIQGFMLGHRTSPEQAVKHIGAWVIKMLAEREKDKESKESKESKDQITTAAAGKNEQPVVQGTKTIDLTLCGKLVGQGLDKEVQRTEKQAEVVEVLEIEKVKKNDEKSCDNATVPELANSKEVEVSKT